MTRSGRHALSVVALSVLWTVAGVRAADSELRLVTEPDPQAGEVIGLEDAVLEESLRDETPTEAPLAPGILTLPTAPPRLESHLPEVEAGSLAPSRPPTEPRDLDFELTEPDGHTNTGEEFSATHFCDQLRARFAWLHGPPLPLISEQWHERTLYVGMFLGGYWGGDLMAARVRQGSGINGGIRLGWDFDDYWGLEGRAVMAGGEVQNLVGPVLLRSAQEKFFDAELLFYPWTTTRFRPFIVGGMGVGVFNYQSEFLVLINKSAVIFPFGLGFKYRHDDWVAFRLDLIDVVAVGDNRQMSNTHNLTLNAGVEFRLGGPRKTYWPWQQRWLW